MIDLSGLSQATLTFWHCFDFSLTTGFEEGQVLHQHRHQHCRRLRFRRWRISAATPLRLDAGNRGPDCLRGQTIQVVWYYRGRFGGPPDGWLVDDVSITGVAAGRGAPS